MRILVASDHWFPDHRGGAARVAAETAALLARRGHDVEVLAPVSHDRPQEEREGSLALHRVLRRTALPQTITDPWETRRAARGRDADVLLAHTTTTAVGLDLARLRAPLVLVYHASAAREARFERATRARSGLRRAATASLEPALRLLEHAALARAQRVLVLSEFSRRLLEIDHPQALARTWRVRGGVHTQVFAPGNRAAARARLGVEPGVELLLAVRRLEPRMGLETLLEALAALRAERPRLELTVVGAGTLQARLDELRRSLGLEDAVRFAGRVPEADLVDWYRAATLAVLPTIAYEGFGLATAEALACGIPVVGTPVGATPELLGPLDARLLADGTSAAELAAAIDRGLAIASPELGRRCRAYAEATLSWSAAYPSWEAGLRGLPDVRRGRPAASRERAAPSAALRSGS